MIPKADTVIQRLRARSSKLRAPLALLYLLLAMASAWHAPHDHSLPARVASQVSSESGSASAAPLDAFCALCSWHSLQQDAAPAQGPVVLSGRLTEEILLPAFSAPAPGVFRAQWARGPPTLLS